MKAAPLPAAALLLLSVGVGAQSAKAQSGGVPAYEPPPPVTITRDGEKMTPEPGFGQGQSQGEDRTAALLSSFTSAYERQGKPRLALYWNRELSDTLTDWYSTSRVVGQEQSSSTMSGDITLNQSGNDRTTMEIQRRVRDDMRSQPDESFAWEFQDGFLAPFLNAGVQVIDRTAMMRLTGMEAGDDGIRAVEMKALQGKADYLMEVLVAGNRSSRVGYELRARVLEVTSGRIVAYVNSKGMKGWNEPNRNVEIMPDGTLRDPDDYDDDDSFGPQGEEKLRIGANGIQTRRKPPKLEKIARSLAYATMDGLLKQWK